MILVNKAHGQVNAFVYYKQARALSELFSHIENCVDEGVFYFKFSELHRLYEQRIETLGFQREINRGRLKEKILQNFPQAQERSDGKNKLLVFEQGMQQMLKQIAKADYEGETLLLRLPRFYAGNLLTSLDFNLMVILLRISTSPQIFYLNATKWY